MPTPHWCLASCAISSNTLLCRLRMKQCILQGRALQFGWILGIKYSVPMDGSLLRKARCYLNSPACLNTLDHLPQPSGPEYLCIRAESCFSDFLSVMCLRPLPWRFRKVTSPFYRLSRGDRTYSANKLWALTCKVRGHLTFPVGVEGQL